MEQKLIWSPASVDDLQSISDFIRRDSEHYANQVCEALVEAAEELLQFPRLGWRVPETDNDAIRERIVYRYRLIYRVRTGAIEIVAVIHGARDVGPALRGRI